MIKGMLIGLVGGVISSTLVAQAFFAPARQAPVAADTAGMAPGLASPRPILVQSTGPADQGQTISLQTSGGFAVLSGAPGGLKVSAAPLLLDPGQSLVVGGAPVVGARVTGFTPSTGSAKRAGFDADYTQQISPRYSQAQVQALQDLVVQTRQELKALRDAMASHGLIGP